MSIQGFAPIRNALSKLNPRNIQEASERPIRLSLHASDAETYGHMESFLLQGLQPSRRTESATLLSRGPAAGSRNIDEIAIYSEGMPVPRNGIVLRAAAPDEMAREVLRRYPEDALALSRYFLPFRRPHVQQVINSTCRENTLFSITTALPDIIPSFIELPWAIAEFASDSAFLTMNQVRMAFQLAGASDREVGYLEQKSEIAVVVGSAFGWRALARQVVGKIPFGGGLIGKAAIAYAGTKVLGLSLDRYYSTGYTYSRDERRLMYGDAYEQGRKIAQKIFANLRPELQSRLKGSPAERHHQGV